VAKGADTCDRNNPFHTTPFGWAAYNKQTAVVQWMQAHCAIDLHDAVCGDLQDHLRARLQEDPASVNKQIDHADIPQGTPLHWAARLNRGKLAEILLESGADPNILAGDGLTPLDVAEDSQAAGVARLLKQRGGKRAADL
jgi:ankyrin repeat protein